MKSFLPLLVFLALLSGCSKTSESNEKNTATETGSSTSVADLNKQFISAWNAKDSEKAISFLADDVQFLQGETHFKGKAEVGDKWVRSTISTISDLKTYVTSSGSGTDIAYEGGTFSVDVLPAGPQEPLATGEGNFILLWKKGSDDTWKLTYAQLEDLPLRVK
jgi:ketosteroid isomerase-like protein